MISEQVKEAVRDELAGRIRMVMGARYPEILSGLLLSRLAEIAADEALEFFIHPEQNRGDGG